MRVSVTITDYSHDPATVPLPRQLAALAQAADRAGIDTVWVADHLLQRDPTRDVAEPMLEAFTTLGYLAHATSRVRLGTMVAAATYRAPALLIKAITTLDVLSDGRAWLGIGAGYQQDEARAMGLHLPVARERFARLEETLQIAARMFGDDASPYAGTHCRLDQPVNRPQPASRPHPPILIGGSGEQKTLRLVAQFADACNLFDLPDSGATIRHKLEVLRGHCEDLHRDYERIDKTVSTRWPSDMPVSELAAHLDTLAGYGATHAVLLRAEPWTAAAVDSLSGLTHVGGAADQPGDGVA